MSEILRTCVACRAQKDKRDLIRVVKDNNGQVFIDTTHKANGRGAYVCNKDTCVTKAIKTGILSRQLKCEIPEQIKQQLQELVK